MLTALPLLLTAATFAAEPEPDFQPIFDRRTLDGWVGQDMTFWSVEDGAITGTISPEHRPPMNQYLVWQGGLVEDFELKLEFRLTGSSTPDTNGGFQFRSRRLPDGDVAGYQVDNNFGQPWKVRLYDEFGRHDLALEGQYGTLHPDGSRSVGVMQLAPGATDFRLDDWHEYHLIADGPELTLRINGKPVARATDNDADSFEPRGILAMQLHTGPPMKAQFRNLRLKHLRPPAAPGTREALLAEAALHWQLGERTNSHQPPLRMVGSIAAQTTAEGPGARPGSRVAKLDEAFFDPGVDLNRPASWNVAGDAITVSLRARIPEESRTNPLFTKGGGESVHFRLFGDDLPDTPGPDLGFEVRTDRGRFAATFPVSGIDLDAWHDLVGRYDGERVQILCDGKVMAERPATGNLVPNDAPVFIAFEAPSGKLRPSFTGELEEAALWTRALSDEELAAATGPAPTSPE